MKSDKIMPLPRQLQPIADLNCDGILDMRPVIFRVACDLFVSMNHHSADEIQQFSELFAGMHGQIDFDTLKPIAKKLAPHPQTPTSALVALLDRGGDIAKDVLQNARDLKALDIIAKTILENIDFCLVLATRGDLTRDLVARLISQKNDAVLRLVAANLAAPLDGKAQRALLDRAAKLPPLAKCLMLRPDMDREHPVLFFAASPDQRNAIIIAARREFLGREDLKYNPSLELETTRLRLERMAIGRDTNGVVAELSRALGCDLSDAARLFGDASGEAFALSLAAIGFDRDMAIRCFLSMAPTISHDYPCVAKLANLVSQVPQAAAQKLVHGMLGLSGQQVPAPIARMGTRKMLDRAQNLPRESSSSAPLAADFRAKFRA